MHVYHQELAVWILCRLQIYGQWESLCTALCTARSDDLCINSFILQCLVCVCQVPFETRNILELYELIKSEPVPYPEELAIVHVSCLSVYHICCCAADSCLKN